MYESAHARPDGHSTVARLARTAARYGYEGLVVRNHGDEPASYDPTSVSETYDIDVVTAVEIRTDDPSQARGYVGTHRPNHDLVVVHGGNSAINRFATGQPAVDVLAHPTRGDGDVDHVLAREAADNGVRLEVSLRAVLRESGGSRVRAISDARRIQTLIDQYDVPHVVSADARSHLELRAPRELKALGDSIGVDAATVEAGLAEWGRLASRNRDRQSTEYVEPGVRRELDPDDT